MKLPETPPITARDILKTLVLLAIPAVLASIYYGTSLSFQQFLALDHTTPRLLNFWTNALVHDHRPGDGHLIGNITVYLLLVFPCWILHISRGMERRFWTGLAIILTVGPFIVSASSYIAFFELLGLELQNDRGFSGVVSALAGFLLVSVLDTFAQKQEEPVAVLSMGLYFGYLMLGLGVLTGRLAAIGLGLLILVGTYTGTHTRYVAPVIALSTWGHDNRWLSVVIIIAVFVSIFGFALSLPSSIISGDGLTNIVAHGAGLLFGMVIAASLRYQHRRTAADSSATA